MNATASFVLGYILGSWMFVPTLVCLIGALLAYSEHERPVHSVVLTAIILFLAFQKWPVLSHVFDTWYYAAGGVLAYFVFGLLYTRFRWYLYLKVIRTMYLDLRTKYIKDNALEEDFFAQKIHKDGDSDLSRTFLSRAAEAFGLHIAPPCIDALLRRIVPTAGSCKAQIIMRIAYWPTSLVWFMCGHVLKDIGVAIYNRTGLWFQRASESTYKDMI